MKKTEKINDLIPNSLTQHCIAVKLGVRQQSVSEWLKNDSVPPKRAAEFSRITGIPKSKLNPVFCEANNAEVAHG